MADSDEDGRREYADEEFLDAIRDGHKTTQKIADAVGCTRQGADYRLRQLRDESVVMAEKIGNTLVWSIRDEA